MMPLKSAALLWASIVLLIATSSTCSGLSTGRKLNDYTAGVSPPAVNLGTAAQFTVLAYSTVTNTGPTTVCGLIGVSPGTAITGTETLTYSPLMTPNRRATTAEAATAKSDLTAAYLDAASRSANVVSIVVSGAIGDIGGLTFTPGLYRASSASLQISAGNLYLKGNGVFIFQMDSTLLVSTGMKMILLNGAQASNVFWKVGSSATLMVDSETVGNVMALAAVTAMTRAKITGRLFALNAAVTMDSNNICASVPALPCCPASCSARRSLLQAPSAFSIDAVSPPTVNLASAEQYTVLAYSTVTNTGHTTVGGLIGISPGPASHSELPTPNRHASTEVGGVIHASSVPAITGPGTLSYSDLPTPNGRASNTAAATAKADANAAYINAASRVDNVVKINVANIGGHTFTPGLYMTEDSLEVSSGTLYLSGDGTFIFQTTTTLMMSTGMKMVLQDGAQACNVFWKVGSSAIFNVGSEVVGTVLADAGIVVKTGAKITGRLFSVNSAVTMDSNVVVFPS